MVVQDFLNKGIVVLHVGRHKKVCLRDDVRQSKLVKEIYPLRFLPGWNVCCILNSEHRDNWNYCCLNLGEVFRLVLKLSLVSIILREVDYKSCVAAR